MDKEEYIYFKIRGEKGLDAVNEHRSILKKLHASVTKLELFNDWLIFILAGPTGSLFLRGYCKALDEQMEISLLYFIQTTSGKNEEHCDSAIDSFTHCLDKKIRNELAQKNISNKKH